MMRGTFANIRIKNQMMPGVEGGFTVHYPSRERMPIYNAAMRYKAEKVPLVVFAGKEYGTGSSRDWAAGTNKARHPHAEFVGYSTPRNLNDRTYTVVWLALSLDPIDRQHASP
jgi:hypothetical protein